ncbi:response regulator transcription factor [Pandoraea anhela]|uniref:response regulator transcription factor n=1 Tax=Pandoraea anhela TaxID=2508295 RepID=UPI001FE9DF53|nr:response regulator transcription factor [Pandoraea anhela]
MIIRAQPVANRPIRLAFIRVASHLRTSRLRRFHIERGIHVVAEFDAETVCTEARKASRILVVEDDVEVAHELVTVLRGQGHGVVLARFGGEGLKLILQGEFDCVVLDRMLPEIDGLSILITARNVGIETPVLLLSGMATTDDRVKGLRNGASDYLTKPFSIDELLARIDILLSRAGSAVPSTLLVVGDLRLDAVNGKVSRAGIEVLLKPRELRLLEFLMRHANQVVTRAMLFQSVWRYHHDVQTNVIDVHIARLRKKISLNGAHADLIDTVRGTGYVLHA